MPSFAFPKSARLLKRREFLRFHSDSRKFVGEVLVIRYRKGRTPSPRLGITVRKNYGKAIARNLFKRKAREAFRHIAHSLAAGVEISIAPKKTLDILSLPLIHKDLTRFASHDYAAKKHTHP